MTRPDGVFGTYTTSGIVRICRTASTARDEGGDEIDAIGRGTVLVLERFMLGRGKEED